MTTTDDSGQKTLIGVAFAGNLTSCRAIHAGLYQPTIEIYDEETGTIETLRSSQSFRRIEDINDKVCSVFAMPRMALSEDYQEEVIANVKANKKEMPERVVMTWEHDIYEVAGNFLAETFGLPRTKEWVKHYLSLLPINKLQKVDVVTTNLAGDFANLKAFIIKPMTEDEMLSYVQDGIEMGYLKTKTSSNTKVEAVFHENMTTEEYLRQNAAVLFKKLEKYMKPLYDGKTFDKNIAYTNRICVPAQARAVMAMNEILKHKKAGFFSAAMGTGKTQMSITTAYARAKKREESGAKDGYRCLVVAPANVLPKWATSEIPKVLGNTVEINAHLLEKIDSLQYSPNRNEYKLWAKYRKCNNICTIINDTEDALAYVRLIKSGWRIPKGKIHFVLVNTDRMKYHAFGFVLGAKWNPYRFCWESPNTGKALQSPKMKKEDLKNPEFIASWNDVVEAPSKPPTLAEIQEARKKGMLDPHGLPIGYVKKWKPEVRSFQDDYQGEKSNCSLARPALNKFGETKNKKQRWMIAQIFQRMLPRHFHLGIFDEIHQMKAQGSGRGLAFHKILMSCRKSVFLTGTLTNGESSSIQAILWRVYPKELLELGFNHKTTAETWANRYGVIEKVQKLDDNATKVGIQTNRLNNSIIIKEKPGIAPELVANHLLDKTVFLELSDLQLPMITLEEKPIIIELDDDHLDEYKTFHATLYDTCQSLQQDLGSAAWSQFNPATLNYADQPQLGAHIKFKDKDGSELAVVTAPRFPESYETAKERKLVEIVLQRLADNRRVIIYTHYTNEYRTNQRLQKVLKRNGVNATILDSKISNDARFAWLEEQEKKGTKVIITNQRLVEVGLDLMAYPTIIFYQMSDDINTVRQAAKRAHRLGQHRHCEVLYLVNDKTQQMAQFQRLMSRRVAALLVEGAIERSDDLAKYADTSANGITNDLSKMIEASEIANAWTQAAQKDIDANLELVSEDQFQQKIKEAFEKLTAETKQLCGYVEPEDTPEDEIEQFLAQFDDSIIESFLKSFDDSEILNIISAQSEQTKNNTSSQKETTSKKKTSVEEVQFGEQLSLFDFAV
ncbi:helicase-related protein [Calidifontibacillus erzurumensis]|uniref:helicase-related protein n=1 Tax=Calidifontibacillus erzurumensis TaxID=2741433 RepID=UPI0035B56F7F